MLKSYNGYVLRPATAEDAQNYYEGNFSPMDSEVKRLTGTEREFTEDEVKSFFLKCLEWDRYDFLIISPSGKVIGEAVINEVNRKRKRANFRIALFHSEDFGHGIGSWAAENTVDFAFSKGGLDMLELSVFTFNTRAVRVYERLGFTVSEAIDGELIMELSADDWNNNKKHIHQTKE
ncbi:MAG: GNAT family N-acetyltransferase [Clostridia bacterium]|nr:GNAT family N-acetyltransferase [Clostridia bacterium]